MKKIFAVVSRICYFGMDTKKPTRDKRKEQSSVELITLKNILGTGRFEDARPEEQIFGQTLLEPLPNLEHDEHNVDSKLLSHYPTMA